MKCLCSEKFAPLIRRVHTSIQLRILVGVLPLTFALHASAFSIGLCNVVNDEFFLEFDLERCIAEETNLNSGFLVHQRITREALQTITPVPFPDGGLTGFDSKVIEKIVEQNRDTDRLQQERFRHLHFDGESFDEGMYKVKKQYDAILEALRANTPNTFVAHRLLGTALHTIQDFYAHSNFVEIMAINQLKPDDWIVRFGLDESLSNTGFVADSHEATCSPPTPELPLLDYSLPINIGKLTSSFVNYEAGGIFALVIASPYVAANQKCMHGFYPSIYGLNKDNPDQAYNSSYQTTAEVEAKKASERFVQQAIDELAVEERWDSICALLTGESEGCYGRVKVYRISGCRDHPADSVNLVQHRWDNTSSSGDRDTGSSSRQDIAPSGDCIAGDSANYSGFSVCEMDGRFIPKTVTYTRDYAIGENCTGADFFTRSTSVNSFGELRSLDKTVVKSDCVSEEGTSGRDLKYNRRLVIDLKTGVGKVNFSGSDYKYSNRYAVRKHWISYQEAASWEESDVPGSRLEYLLRSPAYYDEPPEACQSNAYRDTWP